MRSEMLLHRYASVEKAGNFRILVSNSSTVNKRTLQSRKINSMKWNWIAPQAVTGSYPTFIGFTCLILFQILLQIKVTDGGCRAQPRDPCESICIYDPQKVQHPNCTLRPVVLLPVNTSYESAAQKVIPVLKIAEQHVKEKQILPQYIKFDWRSYDDKCDSSLAAISAMDGYGKDCAHVYFGPSCEYPLASVSRITKYFRAEGTPLISNGGGTFDFQKPKTNCKDEYYMLIRTGLLSFQVISKAVTAIMKRYNWTQVVLFFERNGQYNVAGLHTCHLMVHTLAEIFRATGIIYSSFATDAGTGNWTEDLIREVGFDHSSKS